jgi:hypothetical protein
LASGFQLVRLIEPILPLDVGGSITQKDSKIPPLLVIKAVPGLGKTNDE